MSDVFVAIPDPSYFISTGRSGEGPLIAEAHGQEWLLLYGSSELAELYIEQVGGSYVPQPADHAQLKLALLRNPSVAGFAWENLVNPVVAKFIDRGDFLKCS